MLTREVIAKDHRPRLQRLRERRVVVECRLQLIHPVGEAGLVLELRLGQLPQALEAGTFVRLGKDDVEPQQGNLLPVEQFIGQFGQPVAPPGPAPDLGQAFFVDVDDDDAFIQCARHSRAQ